MKLDVWGFVWTYKGHRGFSWDQIWDIYIYMLSVYILTYAPPSPPLPTLGLDTATAVEGYMPVARLGTHSVHHLHTVYVCNKHCYYWELTGRGQSLRHYV